MSRRMARILSAPVIQSILEAAAAEGEGYAHWKLAISYLEGRFGEWSHEKAAKHLHQACQAGIPFAPNALVQLLEARLIDESHYESIEHYLRLGAKFGCYETQLKLAIYLMQRVQGDEAKLDEAREVLRLAEWNGSTNAAGYGAYIDVMKSAPSLSLDESLERLNIEAHAGRVGAKRAYAKFYLYAKEHEVISDDVIAILKEAANEGDSIAVCDLFELYITEIISESIFDQALQMKFKKLIEEGIDRALVLQGSYYMKHSSDHPGYIQVAEIMLRMAAEKSNVEANILLMHILMNSDDQKSHSFAFDLALALRARGFGFRVDLLLASLSFQFLARGESDDRFYWNIHLAASKDPKCAFSLAKFYSEKSRRPEPQTKVLFWLQMAMEDGCGEAANYLATEFMKSEKNPWHNEALGLLYSEFAANQGDCSACASLGEYFSGKGQNKLANLSESFRWFEKGAKLNCDYCIRFVIYYLKKGMGMPVDFEAARYWERQMDRIPLNQRCGKNGSKKVPEIERQPAEAKLVAFRNVCPSKETDD